MHLQPAREAQTLVWEALELLRGYADLSSGGVTQVFCALLCLKRIGHGEGLFGRLVVPPELSWSSLLEQEDLGTALNSACRAVEDANPELQETLTIVDFVSAALGSPEQRQTLLTRIIRLISAWGAEIGPHLGPAFDDMLEHLASSSGKSDMHMTPATVADLMVRLLAPTAGMRVCDPACGVGRVLVRCAQRASGAGTRDSIRPPVLHGQERNRQIWALCRLNMLLNGCWPARIEVGDVLRSPRFTDSEGELLHYDRIVADPPLSMGDWGAEQAASDRHGRFPVVPPKNSADYAFILHCLSVLREGGRAVMLTSRGVLFRGGAEQVIRRDLIEKNRLSAIIGLPANILYGTQIAPVILVFHRARPEEHPAEVFMMEAADRFKRRGKQNVLDHSHVDEIAAAFEQRGGQSCRMVPVEEIERNQWNLNLNLYLDLVKPAEQEPLAGMCDAVSAAERRMNEAAARLDEITGRLMGKLSLT